MAKNSDHLAGSFGGENTGGVLSGFLAEEDEFDRRALWRLGSWGVASVAAVVVAVMAHQSSLGWRRDQTATADLVQQANRLQAVARESQNEARRLAAAIDTLNSDRDRLYSRVTVLEQGLDSVTGALARRQDPPAAPPPSAAGETSAPAVAPVATVTPTDKSSSPGASEPAPANIVAREAPKKPPPTPATPLMESRSIMAPPDSAAGKLIEPEPPASTVAAAPLPPVMASAASTGDAEADAGNLSKIQRTEFGVDVGGANSVAGLRALWRGLLKSRANAPLAALRPVIVIKEGTGGFGMQLRLVAGPLRDAAAAARICAAMTENDRACETTIFEGQRLSMEAREQPAAAKPAAPRRRNVARRAAADEPPKKPEATTTASTLSTLFGKKNSE